MSSHALLSASSAHKWLVCTPAARLEEQFPEITSQYAEEGRLAHSIAELKLRKQFVEQMSTKSFNAALKKLQVNPLYNPEMLTYTENYIDYISQQIHAYSSRPYVAAEQKLDFANIVPEGFGTGDCIIIGGNVLHIIDFKYGKGVPVAAERNPQMMLYAIGAINAYHLLYEIRHVKITIMQPRLENISEWELTSEELRQWGETIKEIAQKAFEGKGGYVPGEHCRFCKAKATCRGRVQEFLSLESFNQAIPPIIGNEEVGEILKRGKLLAAWLTNLEEYALNECLNGNEVPGWKAVEGRSTRQFLDADKAFAVVKNAGFDEALLYERKPITLTSVEKLLGKPTFKELLSEHINTPPGKPTLVQNADKRQPITRTSVENDFKGEIENE